MMSFFEISVLVACLVLNFFSSFFVHVYILGMIIHIYSGLKVNDQLVAYATTFLAVRLKKYVWSHHRALKAKV